MADSSRSFLMKQVERVRRGMRNRTVLSHLPFGWTAALLCWAIFLLGRPFLPAGLTSLPLWAEGAITFALGTTLAIFLGVRRAPTKQDAALAIDRECGLRERVISALTLPVQMEDSSVGQAVTEDARQRLTQADLHRPFGPRQRGRDYLWPLLAGALAVGAFFLGPRLGLWLSVGTAQDERASVNAADVQLQMEKLRKVSALQKNADLPPSKELEELALEWDKLINKPIDPANQEQVRDRTREIQDFQDKLKQTAQKMEAKSKDVEAVLAKLRGEKTEGKKGPADDLAKALAKGDFGKAADAVERLRKKMKEKDLAKEDQERLAEQLKEMEDRLRRLMDQKDKKDQLAQDHRDGKLNDAELQRELEELAELERNLEDLADLAEALQDLQDQLGNPEGMALEKMERLLGELKKLEANRDDLEKLWEEVDRLDEAQAALCELCRGEGEKMAKSKGLGLGARGKGMGAGNRPGGRRPIAKEDPDGKVVGSPGRAKVDPRGKPRVTGLGWGGGSFAKIPAKEVGGVIEQAAQEAPEVIERQRIPPEAADLARGYFRKLGGQK